MIRSIVLHLLAPIAGAVPMDMDKHHLPGSMCKHMETVVRSTTVTATMNSGQPAAAPFPTSIIIPSFISQAPASSAPSPAPDSGPDAEPEVVTPFLPQISATAPPPEAIPSPTSSVTPSAPSPAPDSVPSQAPESGPDTEPEVVTPFLPQISATGPPPEAVPSPTSSSVTPSAPSPAPESGPDTEPEVVTPFLPQISATAPPPEAVPSPTSSSVTPSALSPAPDSVPSLAPESGPDVEPELVTPFLPQISATGPPPGAAPSPTSSFVTPSAPARVLPYKPSSGVTIPSAKPGKSPSGYRNVLYFTNWGVYGANYQPADIPADKVTHLLYSFADISADGSVISSDPWSDTQRQYPGDSSQPGNAYGCIKQLYSIKKQNRKLKLVLSIGGWTWSPKIAPAVATEAGRQRFATTAIKLMDDWGFDGIDIDWEFPANSQEAANYVALLKTCREELDKHAAKYARNYHFALTVACPAGPTHYEVMDLRGMDPYVDAWHLMAYDYAGSWDTTTGHQANLFPNPSNPLATKFNTQTALTYYLGQGIHPHKLVVGVPLYGRSFLNTDGMGKPFSGVGKGSVEKGVWSYKVLPLPGAVETFDKTAVGVYSYDSQSRELVSYDNLKSAGIKADYLLQKNLSGAVFWEASGDRKGAESLVGLLASKMGTLDPVQNLLSYPNSQYANIRNNLA